MTSSYVPCCERLVGLRHHHQSPAAARPWEILLRMTASVTRCPRLSASLTPAVNQYPVVFSLYVQYFLLPVTDLLDCDLHWSTSIDPILYMSSHFQDLPSSSWLHGTCILLRTVVVLENQSLWTNFYSTYLIRLLTALGLSFFCKYVDD